MINTFSETHRCLRCKVPMCQKGCPISTNIPGVITALEQNSLETAGQILFDNNPLSLVCSLVCNHEKQCEGHCVLNHKGVPIQFGEIEHYISDAYFDKMPVIKEERNHKKVAIIGSGPAGITISAILTKRGYDVTIFEAKSDLGGVLRYGIPEFRLPKRILDRYHKKLLSIGVKIRFNTTIGGALKIDDLFRDGYKSIFVGTGTWRPKSLGIKGESLGNVNFAIDYLASPETFSLGQRLLIIGVGNAAMDVARTALRHGVQHVYMTSLTDEITASEKEVDSARLEGAQLLYYKIPVEIDDTGVIFKDANTGELEHIDSDSVIVSISQDPKDKLVSTTTGLKANDKGLLETDAEGHTTLPGIFAAGDVVMGAKTVVEAVNQAKQVADHMDAYMKSLEA